MNNIFFDFLKDYKYDEHIGIDYEHENGLFFIYDYTDDYLKEIGYNIFDNNKVFFEFICNATVESIINDKKNDYLKSNNLEDIFIELPHCTSFSNWFCLTLDNLNKIAIKTEHLEDDVNVYIMFTTNDIPMMDRAVLYRFIWDNCINIVIEKLHNFTPYVLYVSYNKKYNMKEIFIENEYWKFKDINDLHDYIDIFEFDKLDLVTGKIFNPIIINANKINLILDKIPLLIKHVVFITNYYRTDDSDAEIIRTKHELTFISSFDNEHNLILTPDNLTLQRLANIQLDEWYTLEYRFLSIIIIHPFMFNFVKNAQMCNFEFTGFGKITNIIENPNWEDYLIERECGENERCKIFTDLKNNINNILVEFS